MCMFSLIRGAHKTLKSVMGLLSMFRTSYVLNRCVLNAKPTSPDDDLIKAIVECAINTLNGNHKLTEDDKGKLSKYKNRLRVLVNPNITFKIKRKLLIQKGGFIVPLLTNFLSGVI